ncbi:arginase family protein [Erwinia mallotivora]|uniref:Arginase n=1 Tax=Erwinia mallotivora TaxID=69222 RepID=A0A014NQP6_9GAMM|nr:arginase family protein [Erwinia mallotivora]EXU76155.1 arginase [Erwinia mallotivora]
MSTAVHNTLRLLFPQWQGGNNENYYFGSRLLAWLAPPTIGPTEEVPVVQPASTPLVTENGIVGREQIRTQLAAARKIIHRHQPDSMVVLGGDCLVSLAPFSYLVEKYGDDLGVLWVDSHPDVMDPQHFSHAHAHVLGALMGYGDPDLTENIQRPLSPCNIMIAGIHHPLPHEEAFIARHGIATCGPQEIKNGAQPVTDWIEKQGIKYLAVHIDLDVLDPTLFRSVLFARTARGKDDFAGAAEGRLTINEVVTLVNHAASRSQIACITLAEHLPWDAINLKKMLESLPMPG